MLLSPNTVMPMAIDLNLLSSRHFSPRSAEFPSVLLTPSTVSELSARLDTQRARLDAQQSMQSDSLFLSKKRGLAQANESVLSRPNLSRLSSFLADADSSPASQIYLSREGPPLFSSSMPWLSAPWLSSQLNAASQPLGRPSEKPASSMTSPASSLAGGSGRGTTTVTTGQAGLTTRWQASVWASLNEGDRDSKALLAPLVSCDPQEVPARLQRVPPQHLEALPADTLLLVQQFRRYLATRQVPWQGAVAVRPQPVRTTEMPRVLSQFDQLSHGQKQQARNRAEGASEASCALDPEC